MIRTESQQMGVCGSSRTRGSLTILSASRFYFDRGGAQACYMALGRLLREYGHNVIPFAGRHLDNEPTQYDRYFVDRYAEYDLPNLTLWQKLAAGAKAVYALDVMHAIEHITRDVRIDIADVHNIFYQLTPSLFRPLHKAGIPIVHHLHDYAMFCANGVMETHGEVCERCRGHRYYNAIRHKCYHGSVGATTVAVASKVFNNFFGLYDPYISKYIVTSQFQRELMVRWGLPGDRMVVIPLFFDGTTYPEIDDCTEKKRVVFFGEMKRRKGPQVLYEAAKYFPDHEFLFIGDGPMRAVLAERVAKEGTRNVLFSDFLRKEELFGIVQGAACTVMPSVFYESFGRVIIESFYYGKPVIASRIGSIPEVIQDGINGYLFQPGDSHDLVAKLTLVLKDDEKRAEMGRNARHAIKEKYSKELYYERLMTVYKEVLR